MGRGPNPSIRRRGQAPRAEKERSQAQRDRRSVVDDARVGADLPDQFDESDANPDSTMTVPASRIQLDASLGKTRPVVSEMRTLEPAKRTEPYVQG